MSETFSNLPLIFGLLAAIIHVLSGPDHLAAVAPLALNTKFRTWIVGMSWGIGHLAGMLIIGTVFFYFKELIPIEFISAYSEKIVGIMLIIIGLWAFYRIYKLNQPSKHEHLHTHFDEEGKFVMHSHHHLHQETKLHLHKHGKIERQTYWTALGIGIVHGLAGVSHIIGVLPTLAFKSSTDSILYLSGFGVGTILTMIIFSFVLGLIGNSANVKNKNSIYKLINGAAGVCAIFVGIFWIWNTW
jgi:ABC-type nickel/cobalt efflux system permease component RcnA